MSERCGAFSTLTGNICMLENDHEGEHLLPRLSIHEAAKAREIAADPLGAPITTDTVCLLSMAFLDAEDFSERVA